MDLINQLQQPLLQAENKRRGDEWREGDWICIACFNHNYSFRSTCNMCQNITKTENQQILKSLQKNSIKKIYVQRIKAKKLGRMKIKNL